MVLGRWNQEDGSDDICKKHWGGEKLTRIFGGNTEEKKVRQLEFLKIFRVR